MLLGASPAANNLLAFVSASRAGWLRTARSILGGLAAWAVLVVLVSSGLDALLRTSEIAFVALKWIGVAYLLYLPWQFWTADVRTEIEATEVSSLMRREFLTLMGSPKASLLLTAFLPQLFALRVHYLLVEGVAALFWVSAGALVGAHALTPLRRRVVNRGSAGLMGTAAVVLCKSERAA
ncbi:LysE family translocator [Algicella marina]|uniref:LysE family translocator n=1 Tax=Algicella marina TaxID=2683284 RepID=UPI0013794E6A|nr:LysE family transporter [Algicella marina]